MKQQESPRNWIIDVVAGLLHDGQGAEPAVFDRRAEQVLSEAVESVLDTSDLTPVVDELIALAYQLEVEEKSPTAAKLIASVIERAQITAGLRSAAFKERTAAGETRLDAQIRRGEVLTMRFSAFTGRGPAPKEALKFNRMPPKTF